MSVIFRKKKDTDSRHLVLIGPSVGGSVIAEASRRIPERVIGLIGIEALEDIG